MKYIYYKIYQVLSTVREGGEPEVGAWFALGGLEGMNIITIDILLNLFFPEFIPRLSTSSIVYIGLFIYISNYFLLLRKNKHEKIIGTYNKEPKNKSITGNIVVSLYVILTISVLGYLKFKYPP